MTWLEICLYLAGIAVYLILMEGELEKDPHVQWYHKAGFYLAAIFWFLVPLVRVWPYVVAGVDWVREWWGSRV